MTAPLSRTLPDEDIEAMRSLVAEFAHTYRTEGWGSLDDADLLRNAGFLLSVVDQRATCAHCPGATLCRERSGPKHWVMARARLRLNTRDQPVMHGIYARCAVATNHGPWNE
jgi:hypothetical protein